MSKRILGTAVMAAAALAVAPVQAKELGAVTALQQTNTLAKSFLENFLKPANKAGVKSQIIVSPDGQIFTGLKSAVDYIGNSNEIDKEDIESFVNSMR